MPYLFTPKNNRAVVQNAPRNRAALTPAQNAFNGLIPAINEQIDNAVQTAGFELLVYNRLRSGIPCTCANHQKAGQGAGSELVANRNSVGVILDENGSASPETIAELLTGGTFGISSLIDHRQKPGVSPNAHARKSNASSEPVDDPFSERPRKTQPARIEEGNVEADFDGNGYSNALGQNDYSSDPSFDFPLNPFSEGHLVSCPVCFGTGFVGGYSVSNSWRFVADVRMMQFEGGWIDFEKHPAQATLPPGASATVQVRFPKAAFRVDSTQVYLGRSSLASSVQLEYLQGDEFKTLYPRAILGELCDGTIRTIRIRNVSRNEVELSHLEIQTGLSDTALFGDYPELETIADVSVLRATQDIRIVLQTKVPTLSPFDIITDMNHRLAWMVRSVTQNPWGTAMNSIRGFRSNLGLSAQVRRVQSNEIWSNLPFKSKATN